MSLAAAYSNLAALITGDATLMSLLGVDSIKTIYGNREVKALQKHELPALVLEMGDTDLEPEVAGQVSQGGHELRGSLVWYDNEESDAFNAKVAIAELLPKLVMNDATLDDAIDGVWVSKIQSDYGYNHPHQSMGFIVSADVTINR